MLHGRAPPPGPILIINMARAARAFGVRNRRGRTTGQAVEIAVATSGKAVTFSGLAVATGLGGLLVFAAPALR